VKGSAQALGMKGATDEDQPKWKVLVQLMKPVTWVPLVWGVACGAAASGCFTWTPENVAKAAVCMVMTGPCLTGYTQVINDYCDREIDAINEPYRPIPSGKVTETEAIVFLTFLCASGLALAYKLDQWAGHEQPVILLEAIFGSFISYIYSAPPLKLKASGWYGSYALGASYIGLPWWCGQLLFGNNLTLDVVVLTMLYSIAGLGIAIVNDFKSIEGDRQLGLQSLPVAFGVDRAKWITVGTIDATQLGVAAYMYFGLHEEVWGAIIALLTIPQIVAQVRYFIPDPVKNDVKYQASAQPFLVLGILATGVGIGHHNQLIGNIPGL
jgi:chlorophyll synthase